MHGPINTVRAGRIDGLVSQEVLFAWEEGNASLVVDKVVYGTKAGAVLCYSNPPVHQMGNPAVDAYLKGLEQVFERKDELTFLLLYGANDPVHAGGDLKESLLKLDYTLEHKRGLEQQGASAEKIDALFDWADRRLVKGIGIHASVRRLAESMRVVAVCGGGTRYGGSAEIALMADYLVGDSRSGMCFSESMIGLIPGWSGIGRAMIKAGSVNAACMAKTGREVPACELEAIGIYNAVVNVPLAFPRMHLSDNPPTDQKAYQTWRSKHDEETGLLLLPKGLELATCDEGVIPQRSESARRMLVHPEAIAHEVSRRSEPATYAALWGKPLHEVKDQLAAVGRPLAPQSIVALTSLLDGGSTERFDEHAFVKAEMEADARLYRDRRFRAGLVAALEQRVADYR